MKIETEHPFEDYCGYIVINPDGRRSICLKHKQNKSRTTTSYARYLMSVKEGRKLSSAEHVDHIDGDKTHDSIDNLQILSPKENNIKKFVETDSTRKMVEMRCHSCSKTFSRPLNNTFLQKKGSYSACSRQCSYNILKKGLSVEELKELGNSQIIRHYRK